MTMDMYIKEDSFKIAVESEISKMMDSYRDIRVDMKKNGYDWEKSRKVAQLERTISAFNVALKEYNAL